MAEIRVPEVVSEPLAEGTPNLRVPLIFTEPVADGYPSLRVDLVLSEPLAEGSPHLRVSEVLSEPLSEGYPKLRVAFICSETLVSIPEYIPHVFPFEVYLSMQVFPTLIGLAWSVTKKPVFSTRKSKHVSARSVKAANYPYPLWEFGLTYDYLPESPADDSDLKTLMGFFLQMQGTFGTFLFKDPTDYTVLDQLQATGDGVTLQFFAMRILGGFTEPVGQINFDELLTFVPGDVDTGSDVISAPAHGILPGTGPIAISNAGAVPTGLDTNVTYWLSVPDANHFGFSLSKADALAGTLVGLSAVGSGTNLITRDIAVYVNGVLQDKTDYTIGLPNMIVFPVAPVLGDLITATFWFYFQTEFPDDLEFENFMESLWQLQKCDLLSVIP